MGSNFQYGILAGFKAITSIQNNILRNAQGYLQPGYNRTNVTVNGTASGSLTSGQIGTTTGGSKNGMSAGGDTLRIGETTIDFEQGTLDPAGSPTQLGIKGDGFFIVAENLDPGARLFLTRNGDFKYDAGGRLVNNQGLFVVGGQGGLTDPPTPVRNPGDGTVDLTQITLGTVNVRNNLAVSGYGPLNYQATLISGAIQPFQNGSPQVGFVQSSTLEIPRRSGISAELGMESARAQQHYKIFKDMLENFNKTTDDALSVVK